MNKSESRTKRISYSIAFNVCGRKKVTGIVDVSGRRYMYPTSHLYATLLLCRLLIVGELNSFVIVVSVEAVTAVAVIVSGVLTVEAVQAKRCRSFVLPQTQGYKNYHRHNRILP